jgi:hypothetical protein
MAAEAGSDQRKIRLVYGALSIRVRHFERAVLLGSWDKKNVGKALENHVHLPDRAAAADVEELIARFGSFAASEAAARADRSRDLGNVVHFCRWRQIERMILLLTADRGQRAIH